MNMMIMIMNKITINMMMMIMSWIIMNMMMMIMNKITKNMMMMIMSRIIMNMMMMMMILAMLLLTICSERVSKSIAIYDFVLARDWQGCGLCKKCKDFGPMKNLPPVDEIQLWLNHIMNCLFEAEKINLSAQKLRIILLNDYLFAKAV